MKLPSRLACLTVFGALVMTSGIYRKLSRPEGWPAFWFGVVVGAGVLLGAWLIRCGKPAIGYFLGVLGLSLVVGWFGYECFIKKPWAAVEPRPLAELALGVLITVLLLMPRRTAAKNARFEAGSE
jgi:hypothetical protein